MTPETGVAATLTPTRSKEPGPCRCQQPPKTAPARREFAATARAAGAEGEAAALRDALADLSRHLDRAEERLAQPWWRKLLG
jgi:hypothetical protein